MKKLLSLLAATGLIASSLLATAVPAHAEGVTDITLTSGVKVKGLVIRSKECKPIPMSMTFRAEPADTLFDLVGATLLISRAGDPGWEEYLFAERADRVLSNDRVVSITDEDISPWEWCPKKGDGHISGLGTFKVGVEDLVWWDAGTFPDIDAARTGVPALGATTFTVKQASKVSSAKISKKGTTRTLSATFTYFDITKKAKKEWTALPKNTKVELQRRAANGKGSWKKIKTVKVGSKGAAKTTYKTSTTYQYRFVYAGNSTKAPVTSKTLKK